MSVYPTGEEDDPLKEDDMLNSSVEMQIDDEESPFVQINSCHLQDFNARQDYSEPLSAGYSTSYDVSDFWGITDVPTTSQREQYDPLSGLGYFEMPPAENPTISVQFGYTTLDPTSQADHSKIGETVPTNNDEPARLDISNLNTDPDEEFDATAEFAVESSSSSIESVPVAVPFEPQAHADWVSFEQIIVAEEEKRKRSNSSPTVYIQDSTERSDSRGGHDSGFTLSFAKEVDSHYQPPIDHNRYGSPYVNEHKESTNELSRIASKPRPLRSSGASTTSSSLSSSIRVTKSSGPNEIDRPEEVVPTPANRLPLPPHRIIKQIGRQAYMNSVKPYIYPNDPKTAKYTLNTLNEIKTSGVSTNMISKTRIGHSKDDEHSQHNHEDVQRSNVVHAQYASPITEKTKSTPFPHKNKTEQSTARTVITTDEEGKEESTSEIRNEATDVVIVTDTVGKGKPQFTWPASISFMEDRDTYEDHDSSNSSEDEAFTNERTEKSTKRITEERKKKSQKMTMNVKTKSLGKDAVKRTENETVPVVVPKASAKVRVSSGVDNDREEITTCDENNNAVTDIRAASSSYINNKKEEKRREVVETPEFEKTVNIDVIHCDENSPIQKIAEEVFSAVEDDGIKTMVAEKDDDEIPPTLSLQSLTQETYVRKRLSSFCSHLGIKSSDGMNQASAEDKANIDNIGRKEPSSDQDLEELVEKYPQLNETTPQDQLNKNDSLRVFVPRPPNLTPSYSHLAPKPFSSFSTLKNTSDVYSPKTPSTGKSFNIPNPSVTSSTLKRRRIDTQSSSQMLVCPRSVQRPPYAIDRERDPMPAAISNSSDSSGSSGVRFMIQKQATRTANAPLQSPTPSAIAQQRALFFGSRPCLCTSECSGLKMRAVRMEHYYPAYGDKRMKFRPHLCEQSRVLVARVAKWNREYARRISLHSAGTIWERPDCVTAQQFGFCSSTVQRCVDLADACVMEKCTQKMGISTDGLDKLKKQFEDETELFGEKMDIPRSFNADIPTNYDRKNAMKLLKQRDEKKIETKELVIDKSTTSSMLKKNEPVILDSKTNPMETVESYVKKTMVKIENETETSTKTKPELPERPKRRVASFSPSSAPPVPLRQDLHPVRRNSTRGRPPLRGRAVVKGLLRSSDVSTSLKKEVSGGPPSPPPVKRTRGRPVGSGKPRTNRYEIVTAKFMSPTVKDETAKNASLDQIPFCESAAKSDPQSQSIRKNDSVDQHLTSVDESLAEEEQGPSSIVS